METLKDECAWFLEKLKYFCRRQENCKDEVTFELTVIKD